MAYINHERANELTRRIMEVPGVLSTRFLEDKRLWMVYVSNPEPKKTREDVNKIAREYGAPVEFDTYPDPIGV